MCVGAESGKQRKRNDEAMESLQEKTGVSDEIVYGSIFTLTLAEIFNHIESRPDQQNTESRAKATLMKFGLLAGDEARSAIRRVTDATEQIREGLAALLTSPNEAEALPDMPDHHLALKSLLQLPNIPGLPKRGRELFESVKDEVKYKETISIIVGMSMARGEWQDYAHWERVDAEAALLGIEAYYEAMSLLASLKHYKRDFRPALMFYYLARRLGSDHLKKQAHIAMQYDQQGERNGMVCRKAKRFILTKWPDLSEGEKELACDRYSEAFIKAFDYLPVEAVLHPGLAIGYAETTAGRASERGLLLVRDQEPSVRVIDLEYKKPASIPDHISDELWQQIAPLLPPPKPKKRRPRMPDRQAMEAIFYVLRSGTAWKAIPTYLGASSTIHGRYKEWKDANVFRRLVQEGIIVLPED